MGTAAALARWDQAPEPSLLPDGPVRRGWEIHMNKMILKTGTYFISIQPNLDV